MIDFIDLIEFCCMHDRKLTGIKVYGKLTGEMDRPHSLASTVKVDADCVCCRVEVIAVSLKGYAQELQRLGICSSDGIYFANGSISVFVKKGVPLDDWYCFDGTLRLATRMDLSVPVMAMFNFYTGAVRGVWNVRQTNISDIGVLDFDTAHGRVYDYILRSNNIGHIVLPEEVLELPKFYEDIPDKYESLFNQVYNTDIVVSQSCQDNESNQDNSVDDLTEDMITDDEEYFSEGVVTSVKENFCSEHYNLIKPSSLKSIKEVSDIATEYRERFMNLIRCNYALSKTATRPVKDLLIRLRNNYTDTRGSYISTGEQLLREYLIKCGVNLSQEYLGVSMWVFLQGIFKDICKIVINGEEDTVFATGTAQAIVDRYLKDGEQVFAGILGVITGVSINSLTETATYLAKQGISFSRLVTDNPYLLSLVGGLLSINEVEYLALIFGKAESMEETLMHRTIQAYRLSGVVLDYINHTASTETLNNRVSIGTWFMGSSITDKAYSQIQTNGTPISQNILRNLQGYFYGTNSIYPVYTSVDWLQVGNVYKRVIPQSDVDSALQLLIDCGLVVSYIHIKTEYIISWNRFISEFGCYERLVLNNSERAYSTVQVDKFISDFEAETCKNLTDKQKTAVRLINFRGFAIEGMLKSGKTLVTDCIKYVLSKLSINHRYTEYDFSDGSPVITDTTVQTNSTNRITSSMLPDSITKSADLYILKGLENATADSLFTVLNTISSTSQIVLIGDLNVGIREDRGYIFEKLTHYMPTVVLSDYESQDGVARGIEQYMHCRSKFSNNYEDWGRQLSIIPTKETYLISYLLCKYHSGTLTDSEKVLLNERLPNGLVSIPILHSRDIQVFTTVDDFMADNGCYDLNNVLRGGFNTSGSSGFVWGTSVNKVCFHLGDRVQHVVNTDVNQSYLRYTIEGKVCTATGKVGVPYGAVGSVAGVFRAGDCKFDLSNVNEIGVRNDADFSVKNPDAVFIIIRYIDKNADSGFYVLYRAFVDVSDKSEYRVFTGGDTGNVQLSYCITESRITTKNRLAIVVVGEGKSGVLNRNKLYSLFSCAEDGLYIIGNVDLSRGSEFIEARKKVSHSHTHMLGDIL